MRPAIRSRLSAALVAAVAGAAVITASAGAAGSAAAADSFYVPPSPLPAGQPGDVIRSEPTKFYLDPARTKEANADTHRVMYLSTDTHGDPMAVTGTVLTSRYPWLGLGPRPIIGFAVGTQGMGDQCAPSRRMAGGLEYEGTFLEGLLQRGYGVAVTDYQGLGTPGNHTYVNRAAEANAALDSIRAAQRLPEAKLPDSGTVVTAGYSQGGNASAAAGEVAATYAPELKLRGSYAGAPPADKAAVGEHLDGSHAAGLLGYAIIGLDAAYPELGIRDLLNANGQKLWAEIEQECVEETLVQHALKQSKNFTKDGRSVSEIIAEEPFASAVEQQKLGNRKPANPALVVHSRTDDIVPFEQGRQMARDWCAQRASVRFKTLTSGTHIGAMPEASTEAFMWMEERISGMPHFGNCGTF